ncbi:integrase catalytic domain-containing protein, partial [Trichonephila clavata]
SVLFKMDAANQALLERAKRARSVSRSLVTKQINKLENEINNSADKTTVHEIYVQLISKYEELSTLDKEVESLINIESLEDEILTREEYRDKFIIWKIRAERYIGTVSSITFQNSVENQPQNVTPLNNTVSSVLTNQPRLPKLTLESFSGKDISSFPSFWARFKSAVDDNSNLNDVDKFSYLKSVVTSDAELAIRGLTLTPENYAKAVKILEDRFGRKELIVDYHMNRLLNLSPVRKSFDVIALRKLYDQLEINIRGLESLEIFPDSYSCLLFPIIMKAIPPDLALEYNKKHNEKQSQVTDLTTYLRGEVESRERTEILLKPHGSHSYPNKYSERAPPIYPQPNRKGQGHSRFYPSHKSGVRASANELLSAAVSNCLFCSEDTHASDMCENLCVQEREPINKGRELENSLKQNSAYRFREREVDVKPTSSNSVLHNRGGVLLQCVKAEVIGHISSDKIFCLFDNGNGRYRVSLPWKPGMREVLQNNKTVARKRFEGLVRRFKCDHELFSTTQWQQWSSEAEGLTEIKIPRFYLGDVDQELSSVDIHCFSDASKSAYGTILYLRFVTCNNKIETSFICSKSRVAPLKSLTLPRLELTAALLSARLAKQVSSCLKFNANIYYWTDSLISYYWICGDSSAFKPYIKNSVQEIQLLSDPSQWGHCPGKDNPADLISRGTSAVKLAQNELWWHGPPWLKLAPDHWPNRQRDILDPELCSEELEYRSSVHVAVTQQRESLVDINRFSSLKKLLKVTAWVFRFVNNARIVNKSMNFYITADEIQNAEYFWLKYVQYEFYSAEILTLKRNEQLRCSSEIKSLVPYLGEDNLLRITGRLLEADLCFGEKHPVILPRHCKFTELLVIREHERIGHCGVSATLTQLRKNYWIPKGRQLVKTIIRICLICKNYNAKPADQLSGQLPRDRITQSPPFQIVGIDFTGAILVKDNQETHKSYVSLFTCAVTRAVHLELVSDMSTKCFLLALRRFLARRGNCKVIYSDNARTFKAAEKELAYFANILKDSEFQNFVADKSIHWKFIVERAPWWGGFYERLVKTIKDPLRKILGKALLMFEELSTILSEVEVIVNHRPLTYVENDPGEPEPLTPAHFLELGYGDSKYPIHFIELIDATTARESYPKRKTYRTLLLKQLWRRWKEQYLLRLKTVNHFKTPSVHKNLKLNDIVLVEGNVKSKLLWELGIIKEIFIGRDNNVRSCLVKTSKGLFKKPIQLLYPLELE